VLIDENGCQVVADGDVKIIINDTTKIDFSYSPECIFEGESFVLEAMADETDLALEWMIEDKPVGANTELSIALDTAGLHKVTLHAINQYGCASAISHTLPVHGRLTFIPNVFTPNSDGDNTYFMIRDIEKSKWDIHIYNRYGSPVYEKNDYTNDWGGGDLPSGVYYYSVINSFCVDRSYKGIISIMR
jgi:gliding motility-associated-like protein